MSPIQQLGVDKENHVADSETASSPGQPLSTMAEVNPAHCAARHTPSRRADDNQQQVKVVAFVFHGEFHCTGVSIGVRLDEDLVETRTARASRARGIRDHAAVET